MAGRGLGTLTLDLAVKIGGFTAGLDKAGRELERRAGAMEKRAAKFGKVIGASLVAGATAFGYAVKSAIDQADELNDASKKIGIPTDVLSQLQYAAKLSGVASEELQGGLVKMIKFQAAAAQGAKENVRVFTALGIAIKDSGGNLRDSRALFEDFAQVFADLKDGPEKTALALKVFGKTGAELVPLLNEGKAGIRGMADELDRLGGTVAPETARAADEFNDQIEALKTQVGGLALSVSADLLPDLIDLVKSFRETTGTGEGLKDTAHSIAEGFRDIVGAVRGGINVLQAFGNAYIGVAAKMQEWQANSPMGRLLGLDGKTSADVSAFAFDDMRRNLGEAANSWNGSTGGKDPRIADWDTPAGRVPRGRDLGGLFSPEQKGAKAHKAAVDQVAEAYKRMKAQMQEQIALFGQTTEVAKLRYQLENDELLSKLIPARKEELLLLAAQQDLQNENAKQAERRKELIEEEAKALSEHKESVAQLLSDIAFETQLIGLNNDERERMIALRGLNGEATADEAAQIESAMQSLQAAQKADGELRYAMDEFRGNFSDTVTDVLTGAQSISDAFKSMVDSIVAQIARIIANQVTESLFGAPGSTGGGSGGGWLSSLFSAFLPHHAAGTNFAPGGPSVVGEHGPEIVNLPRGSQVIPNHKLGGSINITINGGSDPRETALQAGREVRRVLAFSGRG